MSKQAVRDADESEDVVAPKLEYEAEWTAEIDRRMAEIRDGSAKLVKWEDTLARMRERIEAARRRR